MKLEKIIAKNFLTYEELEYDFENRPLQVQGRNLTDEGQASNGSGKSGLQTAIEFCITASNSRGCRDNELVTFGQSESNVQLIASCDIRKERIHINWTIKVKSSNKLSLSKQSYNGDWEEISFSNLNDGKKSIMTWFDISKEDLFNYFLINKARFKSFFESSNREKVDLINRFSDASIIEGIENVDTDELQKEFNQKQTEIIQTQTRIDVITEEVEEEKIRDFDEEYDEVIEDIGEDLRIANNKIIASEKSIKDLLNSNGDLVLKTEDIKLDIRDGFEELEMTLREAETHKEKSEEVEDKLAEVQEVLSSFKGLDNSKEREGLKGEIRDSEDQVEVFDNSLDQLENKKELLLSLIQKTNVKLSGTITCPSCAHDFVLDGDLDELKSQKIAAEKLSVRLDKRIEDQQAAQNILNDQIVTFFEQIKELKLLEEKSLEGKSDLIKAVQEVQKNHSNHLTKGGRLSREVSDIKDGIADYKRDIEMANEAIKNNKIIISSQNENIATFNETIKALKLKMSSVKKSDNKEILKSLAKDISIIRSYRISFKQISSRNEK